MTKIIDELHPGPVTDNPQSVESKRLEAPWEWAVLELLGHHRIVCLIRRSGRLGFPMLEVKPPDIDPYLVSPNAIYRITPLAEEQAKRRFGTQTNCVEHGGEYLNPYEGTGLKSAPVRFFLDDVGDAVQDPADHLVDEPADDTDFPSVMVPTYRAGLLIVKLGRLVGRQLCCPEHDAPLFPATNLCPGCKSVIVRPAAEGAHIECPCCGPIANHPEDRCALCNAAKMLHEKAAT